MQIFFPYQITSTGTTAEATEALHVTQAIEQVLFTAPGERVNRPSFGSGVRTLVFVPNSEEMSTAAEFLIQSSLLQWLGDVIRVDSVRVSCDDEMMQVDVAYVWLVDQQRRSQTFTRLISSL